MRPCEEKNTGIREHSGGNSHQIQDIALAFWYSGTLLFFQLMQHLLTILNVIVSILLLTSILLQHRASGLSATFGGSGAGAYVQRRGAEKVLYQLSIWLGVVFFTIPIVQWYLT